MQSLEGELLMRHLGEDVRGAGFGVQSSCQVGKHSMRWRLKTGWMNCLEGEMRIRTKPRRKMKEWINTLRKTWEATDSK